MNLPKFLIADDGADRDFVIHCHHPRMIIEFANNQGTAEFLESEEAFIQQEIAKGIEPAQTLARLMREAGEFFLQQS